MYRISHSRGNRKVCCGLDSFQVTGDGHGCRPIGSQPFSLQPPEPGCQLLRPSCPPVLVSSSHVPSQSSGFPILPPLSPASPYTQYSILHTRYSRLSLLHLCTGAALRFAPLHGLSLQPTCPLLAQRAKLTPPSLSSTDIAPCSNPRRSGRNPCGPG